LVACLSTCKITCLLNHMLAKKRNIYKTEKPASKPKTSRQMERHLKGAANHRRIEMIFLIGGRKGISVEGISMALKCNIKTASMHLIRLEHAGLVRKRNDGNMVAHELSPYGKIIYKFLKTFSTQT